MANRMVEVLDQKIKELEAQVEGMRTFRELVAKNPSVATEVIAAAIDKNSNGYFDPTEPDSKMPESKALAPVLNFFKVNKNEWATVPEIVRATGLTANACHVLMTHGKHRFDFEWKKTSTRRKYWRLKVHDPEASTKEKKSATKKSSKKKTPVAGPKEESRKAPRPKWAPEGEEYEFTETGDTRRVK